VPTADLLRFKRLTIDQLFGPGSPRIDISFKMDARVTVLHGRNGSGKTITLGLVHALREGHFAELRRYPFKNFVLELSDGTTLAIEPTTADDWKQTRRGERTALKPERCSLRYLIRTSGGETEEGELPEAGNRSEHEFLQQIVRDMPWLSPHDADTWVDQRSGRLFSTAGLLRRYAGAEPTIQKDLFTGEGKVRPALKKLLARLPPVKFIRADRLFIRTPDADAVPRGRETRGQYMKNDLMVERLSQDIRALVMDADRQYRLISTRLDTSLAKRIFKPHKDTPTLEELKTRSKALREQAKGLKELGLLKEEPDALDEGTLTEEQKGTFFIILRDREEKLAPFTLVVDKAQHLLQSLKRKLAPKSVRLDVETGYQVMTAAGTPLDLSCLSSGEQHELVLLHELLFDVQPGSLILIDEPELSLHVTWQKDLLPELLEIARLSDLDFVLATHSPYIVGEHEELMVRLGEPV
jgi:ABC-type transport system involved in cytochrome c biogenesis ATPase subunit